MCVFNIIYVFRVCVCALEQLSTTCSGYVGSGEGKVSVVANDASSKLLAWGCCANDASRKLLAMGLLC